MIKYTPIETSYNRLPVISTFCIKHECKDKHYKTRPFKKKSVQIKYDSSICRITQIRKYPHYLSMLSKTLFFHCLNDVVIKNAKKHIEITDTANVH